MDIEMFREAVLTEVLESMFFMLDEDDDYGFTKDDIEKCKNLLFDYLDALNAMTAPTDEKIMKEVEKIVLALNDLNESVDYTLIETAEREAICEIIQNSAIACGLQTASDDITEDWRDF